MRTDTCIYELQCANDLQKGKQGEGRGEESEEPPFTKAAALGTNPLQKGASHPVHQVSNARPGKHFLPLTACLILTPNHGLPHSAEGCNDHEIPAFRRSANRPAGTSSCPQSATACVCTLSFHKTNGTLGQRGKGYKITHHSSLIRKDLTGDS